MERYLPRVLGSPSSVRPRRIGGRVEDVGGKEKADKGSKVGFKTIYQNGCPENTYTFSLNNVIFRDFQIICN